MNVIEINHLIKIFRLYNSPRDRVKEIISLRRKKYHHDFYALNDITFTVEKGETIGIIGRNGSGKSTLLKIICGVVQPTSGSVSVNGRISSLLELGAGFNPDFTGRENVYMNGALMGFSRREIDSRFSEIEAFADIGEFIDQPVKAYSSGMYVRLAFACAVNVDPDILVIDEALSVGDQQFQKKCMRKLDEFRADSKTILFVSHNLYAIRSFCNRCIWIKNGSITASGESNDIVNRYMDETQEISTISLGDRGNKVRASRWGTSDVVVTRARILDDKEDEKYVFKTGDDMILEVTYFAKEKVNKPTFAYSICTKGDIKLDQIRVNPFSNEGEQIRVTSYNTKWENCSPRYIIGQGIVRVRLNDIPLLPGYYTFLFAIRDEYDLIIYDIIVDLISFKIIEGDNKKGILGSCGILYYPTKWEFAEAVDVNKLINYEKTDNV